MDEPIDHWSSAFWASRTTF